jgi:SAM-dependent methyltransferase
MAAPNKKRARVQASYTVKPGDTLARVARKTLGNPAAWQLLWRANRDVLPDPNSLPVGLELRVPHESGDAEAAAAAGAASPAQPEADAQKPPPAAPAAPSPEAAEGAGVACEQAQGGALRVWARAPTAAADMREPERFATERLRASLSLPVEGAASSLFKLPDRGAALALVVAEPAQVTPLRQFLKSRGWQRVGPVFVDRPALWRCAEELGVCERGRPASEPFLSQPSPVVQRFVQLVEDALAETRGAIAKPAPPAAAAAAAAAPANGDEAAAKRFTACDVGCGSGRDAVFLALRGRWSVTGVDWWAAALRRMQLYAGSVGVAEHVRAVRAKIRQNDGSVHIRHLAGGGGGGGGAAAAAAAAAAEEEGDDDEKAAPADGTGAPLFHEQQYDLVLCIRFLERAFFPQLVRMVAPGGFVLYSTFMEGAAHPNDPRRLLKQGELREMFRGWRIVCDEVEPLADGRPLCVFLAQKPA